MKLTMDGFIQWFNEIPWPIKMVACVVAPVLTVLWLYCLMTED